MVFVFCPLVVPVWMSVTVQVSDLRDSSPKCPIMRRCETLKPYSFTYPLILKFAYRKRIYRKINGDFHVIS